MRGLGKKLPSTSTLLPSSSSSALPYSTFGGGGGGGGGGRGRGRGFIPPPSPPHPQDQETSPLPSAGHGRGAPSASAAAGDGGGPRHPIFPSFPAFSSPSIGRGRPDPTATKQPIFFSRDKSPLQFSGPDDDKTLDSGPYPHPHPPPSQPMPALAGAGRGKALPVPAPKLPEINRHARPRQPLGGPAASVGPAAPAGQKLNREEAIKRAVEVLLRGGGGGGGRGGGRGRGVGMRGRGRGRGGGRGRRDADDELELYVGDNADGERFVKKMGEERMKLVEAAFEEVSYNVLPSPAEDAYLDALHTNNMIEYEPEYLMEFDRNPDIDENPPMSLEEVLQKAKPFLMAYEGIESQEEWEEIIKDLMERLPHMKELIDMYCGPDRVTAKQQMQELERVAKTLPENIPSSVKRFTDRAVLSLQSNPGWGWDKKCQFMDKLVWEVTQHYK